MISKQEIEEAKERLVKQAVTSSVCCEDYPNCICMKKDLIIALNYIDQLEQENKKLNKREFDCKSDKRINIQEIKYIDELEHGVMGTYIDENKRVINELVKAVKQLDRQINLK